MQYDHPTRVGRVTVVDTGHTTEKLSDGSPAITAEELGRLERRAALSVSSEVDDIGGAEVKSARKAQPARTHAELTLRAKAS